MSTTVAITVPCFNEAERFSAEAFARFFDNRRVRLLFIDDGSSDDTREVLGRFCGQYAGRAELMALPQNRGKAEAVRAGINRSLDEGAELIGYTDADLSTPVSEVIRMIELLDGSPVDGVLGSRVAVLGADIQRAPSRHYLGRLFATGAALVLRRRIYDTQCGAKLFRCSQLLKDAMAQPFRSRWAFDVELIGRLLQADAKLVEMPLHRWIDAPGSKLGTAAMVGAGLDLIRIARGLRRRSRAGISGREDPR